MEAEIRSVRLEDAAQLARIAAASLDEAWSQESFRSALRSEHSVGAVAELKGLGVVGYALGREVEGELEIVSLAVEPARRRCGLAGELLRSWLAARRTRGVRRAVLEVRASNQPAQRLYANLGFVASGRRPRYYADGEDALLLEVGL